MTSVSRFLVPWAAAIAVSVAIDVYYGRPVVFADVILSFVTFPALVGYFAGAYFVIEKFEMPILGWTLVVLGISAITFGLVRFT